MLTFPEIFLIVLVMLGWVIAAIKPAQRIIWDTIIALVLVCLISLNA